MKVYSDTLDRNDLYEAAHGTPGVQITSTKMNRPRIRARGWAVTLTCPSSNRHQNSGTHDAATWMPSAASWDQYGQWMALVFERDPDARIAEYDGREAFHRATKNKYSPSEVS